MEMYMDARRSRVGIDPETVDLRTGFIQPYCTFRNKRDGIAICSSRAVDGLSSCIVGYPFGEPFQSDGKLADSCSSR